MCSCGSVDKTTDSQPSGSNLPAAAVVALGKALYPHCLVPQIGLEVISPLVTYIQVVCFLRGQVKEIQLM